MNIFRFLEWEMYKDAKKLNRKIGKIVEVFSIDMKKKYGSQANRASLSVCLNIAEASGRYSDAEMCRFFDFSLGSLAEIVACTDSMKDEMLITEILFNEIHTDAFHIAKQIKGMQYSAHKSPRVYGKK